MTTLSNFSYLQTDLLQKTEEFLEDLKTEWLSDREYTQLKQLLHKKEGDLVSHYLELQLTLRSSSDRNALHIALELEGELEKHLKNGETSSLKTALSLLSIQQIFIRWLGVDLPMQLDGRSLPKLMEQNLTLVLKEKNTEERLFLEEILNQRDDTLEYWTNVATSLDLLLFWIDQIQEMLHSIKSCTVSHPKELDAFEKQLSSFHKELSKTVKETILPLFSPLSQAAINGMLRRWFHFINQAYEELKSSILKEPVDVHLCCMCHFGEDASLLNLSKLPPFYPVKRGNKPTLLIFTCGGGQAHLCVAKAMSEYARGSYHVQVANTMEETLASTDVFKRMMLDFSHEKLYNHLLKNEDFEWLKIITTVGPFFIMMQQESIERAIRLEVLRQSPDMLISCFPCMNAMFLNIAKEFNLPLLIITTDLDAHLFTNGMHAHSCDINYPKWRLTLAYDTPEMRALVEKRIPASKIHITGFPLRPSFTLPLAESAKQALFQKWGIHPLDRVIIVMIGGIAGRATEKYAAILNSLEEEEIALLTKGNLHVICLCGDQKIDKNQQMLLRIRALEPKSHRLRMHSIGAVEDIATLMSIADVLITKPGGCSTNEALSKGLPMIFHAPFALMDWEVFNMEFTIQARMGLRFKLQSLAVNFLQDGLAKNRQRLIPLIKEAFTMRKESPHYSFQQKNFGKEFLLLVRELLDKKSLS